MKERTLVILKPDCIMRGLAGEVLRRFERRGLKIVGMRMKKLDDEILEEHYSHLKEKPFFAGIKEFMKSAPVILAVLEGNECVKVVRDMCGPTNARNAPAGTIRGDYSLSMQCNIIHASDSIETAKKEVERFFKKKELQEYSNPNEKNGITYSKDESK